MSKTTNKKTAIVLFNLGGPDKLENVKPFLYNLFSDKWIIRAPSFIRKMIAFFISRKRENEACENYEIMGGKSPLLEETIAQKESLKKNLEKRKFGDFEIFIAMRYWHPLTDECMKQVKNYNPDEIIALPLYPHLSSSTTVSSFEEFDKEIEKNNIKAKVKKVGCYFDDSNFIKSHIELIKKSIKKFKDKKNLRILFSAHSIPTKFVKKGDPYEWQINKTFEAVKKDKEISKYECILCYQSKVGPIEWLSPQTEDVIEESAKLGKNMIVIPIAFVSEHIETLVELDVEYKEIADKHDVKYVRVPALSCDKNFIDSLGEIVEKTKKSKQKICCYRTKKCPSEFVNCAHQKCYEV